MKLNFNFKKIIEWIVLFFLMVAALVSTFFLYWSLFMEEPTVYRGLKIFNIVVASVFISLQASPYKRFHAGKWFMLWLGFVLGYSLFTL